MRVLIGVLAAATLMGCGIGGSHYATAGQLLALPEGKLQYPGAELIKQDRQDELHPGNEGATAASVTTRLATADSQDKVIGWYDQQLKVLGYASVTPRAGETAGWRHGAYGYYVIYGPEATLRGAPPPGTTAFETVFTVDPAAG